MCVEGHIVSATKRADPRVRADEGGVEVHVHGEEALCWDQT